MVYFPLCWIFGYASLEPFLPSIHFCEGFLYRTHEQIQGNRFGKVIIETGFSAFFHFKETRPPRNRVYDRDRLASFNLPAQLDPVHPEQLKIQEDQINVVLFEYQERLLTLFCQIDLISGLTESRLKKLANGPLIVNDQHLSAHANLLLELVIGEVHPPDLPAEPSASTFLRRILPYLIKISIIFCSNPVLLGEASTGVRELRQSRICHPV